MRHMFHADLIRDFLEAQVGLFDIVHDPAQTQARGILPVRSGIVSQTVCECVRRCIALHGLAPQVFF